MPNAQHNSAALAKARAVAALGQPIKRAVLYLRVSSQSQVNTDYDPEGLSIPAQRRSCERKAEAMGIEIAGEYVEPGKSATSMDKREAFQMMLERIRTEKDVDYVLVYKLSRMNRNRMDDAIVLMTLREHNVSLISATEHIDESPEGQLMHGILAAMNEFRSRGDGADISYKMGEKARRGGTLGRAPIGYKNVREDYEGREIRTVEVDPERAPLVRLAFELYATDRFTIDALAKELDQRGLRTRPNRHPSQPLSTTHLQTVLTNRYYVGIVTYKGEEFNGRHTPIVEPALFEEVQRILAGRGPVNVRRRTHNHYLKGMLWCDPCHQQGREFRLIRQQSKGNGGTYDYFFCRGRQEHVCTARHVWTDDLEDAVLDFYSRITLPPEFIALVRQKVAEVVHNEENSQRLRRKQIQRQLTQLAKKEDNLIDLASEGGLPNFKVRKRLNAIADQQTVLAAELESIELGLATGAELIEEGLSLLETGADLYSRAEDPQRQLLNRALFHKLYVRDGEIVGAVLHEPFDEFVAAGTSEACLAAFPDWGPFTLRINLNKTDRLETALFGGGGSSNPVMVEVNGLEPSTSTLRT
jgi:site-specific DNA recombinase